MPNLELAAGAIAAIAHHLTSLPQRYKASCPLCYSTRNVVKNGTLRAEQHYKCRRCAYRFVDRPHLKPGPLPIGSGVMTAKQRYD